MSNDKCIWTYHKKIRLYHTECACYITTIEKKPVFKLCLCGKPIEIQEAK